MNNYSGDKIVLMGLPGSGKSTLGKHLSLNLHYQFFDLDALIVDEIGCSITQFFIEQGEEQFRLIESRILKNTLLLDKSFVLSTGGGAPCYHHNIDLINYHSTSVYIDVPLQVLVHRLLSNERSKRPMFFKLSEEEVLEKIMVLKGSREKYYNQAKIKLSGKNISTEHLIYELNRFKS
jgi:shikimate kinase